MPNSIKTKVRGVTAKNDDGYSRQSIIRKYVKAGDTLLLERETDNPADSNAIAIHAVPLDPIEYDDKIGYLSSELASKLAPLAAKGYRMICKVIDVTGGEDGKDYGVNIELLVYTPDEVAELKNRRKQEKQVTSIPQQTNPSQVIVNITQNPDQQTSKHQRREKVVISSDKNWWVTFILCLALGPFGIHYFYVGRFGRGLLFMCTVGLFLFGWLFDLIKILSGTFLDGAGQPVKM